MTLPQRFELVVSPHGHTLEQTGLNTVGDVQTLEATVSAAMDATDQAVAGCAAMASTDVATWQGIYSGWQSWDQSLHGCIDNISPDQWAAPTLSCIGEFGLYWASAMSKLNTYQKTAQTWQQRVHSACANFQPAPAPTPTQPADGGGGGGTPPPAPSGSWLCRTIGVGCGGTTPDSTSTADAVKWVAILGLVFVAAWYVGPLIATLAGVGAGAVRKRASGRDEYEPVALFKRGAGNFSFGNMDVEAPMIEPLQFGDIPRDDVLALIGSVQE